MSREIVITTPENVMVRFELAGIGSRFIAVMIDTLLQGLIAVILILAAIYGIGATSWFDRLGPASAWVIAIIILLFFVITSGYFLYFEMTRNGQTPGKKSAGIRVIRDTGHPVDFRAALLRNVMRIVDSLPGMYGVGIVSVFFSPQYRRLGDYVAGTLVVKVGRVSNVPASRVNAQLEVSSINQTEAILPPESLPYISSIPKEDYRAIRHFLNRKIELEQGIATDLARKLAEPIAQKLKIDPAQITDPIAFLSAFSDEWERRVIH